MGAQIQTKTGHGLGPSPTPVSGPFSAKPLTASLLGLPSLDAISPEQVQSFEKQMGKALWAELESLSQERDAELFYSGVLHLGRRFQDRGKTEWAFRLYGLVAEQTAFSDLTNRAKTSIAALEGRGEVGARAEVLISRFSQDFRDPAMIAPMMIGTSVGGIVRGLGLGRLAALPEAWYSRGLGARITAGSLSYATEVPAFVLSGRALHSMAGTPQAGWRQDFSTAALTLGAIKTFGFAAKQGLAQAHGVNEWGAMTRGMGLARYSHPLAHQASLFGGLTASHWAETQLGLRPQVDGATAFTDTLASMVSLGAGARLGQGLLGRGYARSMHELEWRTQSLQKAAQLPAFEMPRLSPQSAAAAAGLGLLLKSNLALANDGANRWNSQTLTATILSTLAIGGAMAYGYFRLRRAYVAPNRPIQRLRALEQDMTTMIPMRVALEASRARDLLKDSAEGGRRGDATAVEAATAFLERALPKLEANERFEVFSAWIDLLLSGKENFAPPTLAALKRTFQYLEPAGREKLLEKVHVGTRMRQPDKALTCFFLLNALASEFDLKRKNQVYEQAISALEFQAKGRDNNMDNNARLLHTQRALLRELRDFLDKERQETLRGLRDELSELKDGKGFSINREARIAQIEDQLKNPPEPPTSELLRKFGEQSEDPLARHLNIEDALVQAHKLMELFDETSGYKPPNFETEFPLRAHLNTPAMQSYLRNGHSLINPVSSSAIREMLTESLLEIKTD
ncbi:MAG TPA: hypothetical protein VJP40_04340 [bacterium]|nr:hypothetical protein [bacterium]